MNIDPDAVTGNSVVASLAGAILGLRAFPGGSRWERMSNLLFGFLMAVFMGPATVEYFHVTSTKVASGITFVIGAAGLVVFAALTEGVRQTQFAAILSGWLSRNRSTP